ncbi:hypothetical protein CXB40_14870 [Pseudomonas syringae pv. avii]|uniref:phage antirepressor KilAC domain-containing protein n=1 Tax=Pseudomonas syringae TaxID=317 RepID=UPI000CDB1394|nr:phage antirepressor KilAC domain-containing protein [Pseudomonas syringae]POQ07496.1 hypothetical protein CXB40_14870 [Pseudomonas syringae pv. avii]
MSQAVQAVQTMTSLEIVEMINKEREAIEKLTGKEQKVLQHKHFLAKVVATLGETQSAKFLADYNDERNRVQKCYVFPKREATLMAMSYSPAISAAVYDRMTELEEKAEKNLIKLPDFSNPAEAARAWAVEYERSVALAVEVEQKKELLAIAAPKVEFVDQFVEADGALGIQAASRLLKMNMRELGHWLVDAKLCLPSFHDLFPLDRRHGSGLLIVQLASGALY